MGGACVGCTLAPATLHGWVEGTVRQFFPNIEAVTAVAVAPAAPPDTNQFKISD
jgi:Fe-S cluster biogenesis protein NfuA